MLSCLVPVLFAFYLQGVLKFKYKIPATKGAKWMLVVGWWLLCLSWLSWWAVLLPRECVSRSVGDLVLSVGG